MPFQLSDGTVLPNTLSGDQAARLLNAKRSTVYQMISSGTFPTATIRTSPTTSRVITADLLRHLHLTFTEVSAA